MNELNEFVLPNVTNGVVFVVEGSIETTDPNAKQSGLIWKAGFQELTDSGLYVWTSTPGIGKTLGEAVAAFTGGGINVG